MLSEDGLRQKKRNPFLRPPSCMTSDIFHLFQGRMRLNHLRTILLPWLTQRRYLAVIDCPVSTEIEVRLDLGPHTSYDYRESRGKETRVK